MSFRIALVEYLNTFPFSEGLRLNGFEREHEVHHVIPSMCAQLFQERKVDISLCPVGALKDMPDHKICGSYCIGADGEVGTVVLLSNVPVEQISSVKLDDHSRTSNVLLQILALQYWKKDWKYYFEKADPPQSCLMIGDKVFQHKNEFAYSYDLSDAWKSMTGLPMVFAVWIAKPGVPQNIIDQIDQAFERGLESVQENNNTLEQWQKDYLLNCISYTFDDRKKEALELYQSLMP